MGTNEERQGADASEEAVVDAQRSSAEDPSQKIGADNEEETWQDDDFLSFDTNTNKPNDDSKPTTTTDSSAAAPLQTSHTETELSQLTPPWMHTMPPTPPDSRTVRPLVRLHNEIVQFARLVEPTQAEIQQRHELVNRLRGLVEATFRDEQAKVEIFGSLATGLFLPSSDIDLVVTTTTTTTSSKEASESSASEASKKEEVVQLLRRLGDALRTEWLHELSYLELIENTRVPLVKLEHAATQLQVDICFHQEQGVQAAQLIRQYLQALPPLRPLTLVLKYFLAVRALNEPYTGGVGSFMLQLTIVAFLQQREREATAFQRPLTPNLGALLLEYLELYGDLFNYRTTGVSVKDGRMGSFFSKGHPTRKDAFLKPDRLYSMALENPLDASLDVGVSSFRIPMIQRAFSVAHKLLLAHLTVPELLDNSNSILSCIVPPRQALFDRAEKVHGLPKVQSLLTAAAVVDNKAARPRRDPDLSRPLSAPRDSSGGDNRSPPQRKRKR